ncbi:MAG: DUF6517 family protein [Halosimplex sp.]
MDLRRTVAVLAVVIATVTAGCGFLTGQNALEFGASPATASENARAETGYEETNVTASVATRNFSVAGQTRQVEVTNQRAKYERAVDLGPLGSQRAAVFVTFASPEVKVATETFNPISDMSEREILAQFESQYDGVSVGQQVDARNVSTLGRSTRLKKFEGTATLAGTEVDVYVHAAKFKHEGDYVVAVGIYPQRLSSEDEHVATLVRGLEHDGGES